MKDEDFKPIGEGADGFTCKLCFKFYPESESRMGRVGIICDNCDEEPLFSNNKSSDKGNDTQKTNTFITSNTFSSQPPKNLLNRLHEPI